MVSVSRIGGVEGRGGCRLHEADVVGELGDEPSGRVARQARKIGVDQVGKRDALHIRRQSHDDAARLDRLGIEQEAAQRGGADDGHQHVGKLPLWSFINMSKDTLMIIG